MTDVRIPAFGETLDFEIDQDAPIQEVIRQMLLILCELHEATLVSEPEDFFLCSGDGTVIYQPKKSLRDYGVQTGYPLLLI